VRTTSGSGKYNPTEQNRGSGTSRSTKDQVGRGGGEWPSAAAGGPFRGEGEGQGRQGRSHNKACLCLTVGHGVCVGGGVGECGVDGQIARGGARATKAGWSWRDEAAPSGGVGAMWGGAVRCGAVGGRWGRGGECGGGGTCCGAR
jgi:hypothetical protein